MQTKPAVPPIPELRNVDALASVVHRWVGQQSLQQRFAGIVLDRQEELDLAAGFLAGLRGILHLADREASLIAYAFLLKRGGPAAATGAERLAVGRLTGTAASAGYLRGRRAARDLLDEQRFSGRRNDSPL